MAKVKSKYQEVTPRIDYQRIKSLGILAFDEDNLYPSRCEDVVNDSGTAKTSVGIFQKFIFGRGFSDKKFGDTKINSKGLTPKKLLRKIVKSISMHQGFMVHFNFNGLGQKTEVNFVPFKFGRLIDPEDIKNKDKIAIYDDWEGKKKSNPSKKDIKFINRYDPEGVFEQVNAEKGGDLKDKFGKYRGQVWYWTPDGGHVYPLSIYDAVLEDMMTEAEIKRFRHSTSSKNFHASHIIVTGKEEVEDDVIELDEEGNEIARRSSAETGGGIAEDIALFQGGDGVGVVHVELENEDDEFRLEKIEIQDYDGLFEYTEESSKNSIREQFEIPPVLFMKQASSSVASNNEITDAKIYYNEITEHWRDILEEIFAEIFENFEFEVNRNGDFSILPIKAIKPIPSENKEDFTKNERRAALGYLPSEENQADETVLAVTLGVGGTQSLTAILTNPELSSDQKKGTIKVLFGLTDEDINQMITE